MKIEKSLQAMRADLASKEAALKLLKQYHPHLADHSEEEILAYFQVNSINALETHIKQLKVSTQHESNTPTHKSDVCSCMDSHGEPKNLYDSEAFAQEEADILSKQKKVKLSVYPCPYGCGWHLTKR